jgi:hypothetical protein
MNNFSFSPPTGLRDITAYPDEPASEAAAREQFQGLLDQIKNYINNTVVAGFNAESPITPTLQNGWVNYGSPECPIGYYKDGLGNVNIRGMIKNTVSTTNVVLFTLPTGYRPAYRLFVPVSSSNGISQIYIYTDGRVYLYSGEATWLSFDIVFRTGV